MAKMKKDGNGGWIEYIPNPKGNDPLFPAETRDRIIDLLWSGECKSLKDVEALKGMPTRRTMYDWKERYPDFGRELEKAQMALGDVYLHDIHEITKSVKAGTIDPSAANVAIKANQWLAQVTDPRTYANKSYVEKNQNVNVTNTYVQRIDIEGLDDEQLDAIEAAFNAKLLTGPDGGTSTTQ